MCVQVCTKSIDRLCLTTKASSLGGWIMCKNACKLYTEPLTLTLYCTILFTMTQGGRLCFFTLLRRNASRPSVSLAVPRAMRLVVTMALPGHPDAHKESPVA